MCLCLHTGKWDLLLCFQAFILVYSGKAKLRGNSAVTLPDPGLSTTRVKARWDLTQPSDTAHGWPRAPVIPGSNDRPEDYEAKGVMGAVFDLWRSGCAYEEAEGKLTFLRLFLPVLSERVPGNWFVILASVCLSWCIEGSGFLWHGALIVPDIYINRASNID